MHQRLLPRDIKLLRYVGEQRLITEEEIDPRDGKKLRGAFGKIRNPSAQAQAGQPFKDMRTLGTGAWHDQASELGSGAWTNRLT